MASLVLVCAAAYIAYVLARAFYRLYLHPLAKFPGPSIAAVTSWYEAYYEIYLVGQYSRQITKLHDQYGTLLLSHAIRLAPLTRALPGPIVRVTPDELHIRDPRFFDQVYSRSAHLDKEGWDKRFGCAGGLLTTVNAEDHKRRRAAVAPMYAVTPIRVHDVAVAPRDDAD